MFSHVPLSAYILLLALLILNYVRSSFRKGLSSLPGPFLAKFSGIYRLSLVHHGHAPERYRELHENYGPIVRTGPNHVSISDTTMIPTIYGIGSKFLKVFTRILLLLNLTNVNIDPILHHNGPLLPGYENGQSVHNSRPRTP